MESALNKRIIKVILYGLLTGFAGGLVAFFLVFPVGVLLHLMGIKVLIPILKGGIFPMRYMLVSFQTGIALIGIGYFTWKEFYKKN
ncbi:MAG: hypothetical protein HQK97_07165 [Nitrospirae bacterium]|nr:hypothetical protein [Nitrospirota bacterium]